MSSLKKIFVAVDIETTGAFMVQNAINSIGFWIGDEFGTDISSKKFNIEVTWPAIVNGEIINYGDFEPKCWNEFWSKQSSEIIEKCKSGAVSKEEAWKQIREFIDNLEIQFPENSHQIVFVTDNGSFDIAFINYGLEMNTGRAPMRYSSSGKYRQIHQADDAFKTLPKSLNVSEWKRIEGIVKHDHDPVNDAHAIYLMAVSAAAYKKSIGW